jgi:hypothetical protein
MNDTSGPAFPQPIMTEEKMTMRDYFAANAPDTIPSFFKHAEPPKTDAATWNNENRAQRYFQWRFYYADCMMKVRGVQ